MSLAANVQRILATQKARVSVPCTLVRKTVGEIDGATGEAPETFQRVPIKVTVKPASAGTVQAFDNRLENGTLIETNLRALELPAYKLPFAPAPGDLVEGLEGSTWKVLGSTPESMGDGKAQVVLQYNLTVQR